MQIPTITLIEPLLYLLPQPALASVARVTAVQPVRQREAEDTATFDRDMSDNPGSEQQDSTQPQSHGDSKQRVTFHAGSLIDFYA